MRQGVSAASDSLSSARDLFDAGHYAGVVAVCSQALEASPRDATLLLLRARAWVSLGRAAAAIDDLRAVLTVEPRSGSAYRALGRLLLHEGELEAARRAFLAALAIDAGDREARSQLTSVDAALAVEAALAAEARALEEALALADDTGEVPEGGVPHLARASAPHLCALRRMPTQPMPRASTSAAIWRAPTMPLELALASIEDERDGEAETNAAIPSLRAATERMDRGAPSSSPWRAPTLPLSRRAEVLARRDDEAPPPSLGPGARARRAGTAPTPSRAQTVPLSRRDD